MEKILFRALMVVAGMMLAHATISWACLCGEIEHSCTASTGSCPTSTGGQIGEVCGNTQNEIDNYTFTNGSVILGDNSGTVKCISVITCKYTPDGRGGTICSPFITGHIKQRSVYQAC